MHDKAYPSFLLHFRDNWSLQLYTKEHCPCWSMKHRYSRIVAVTVSDTFRIRIPERYGRIRIEYSSEESDYKFLHIMFRYISDISWIRLKYGMNTVRIRHWYVKDTLVVKITIFYSLRYGFVCNFWSFNVGVCLQFLIL